MSKELTPLEALSKLFLSCLPEHYLSYKERYQCKTIIKTALKDYERLVKLRKTAEWADEKLQTKKKLKALEIIKEKDVNVYWLKKSPNLSRYNLAVGTNQALKKDEYDLLKEVLL